MEAWGDELGGRGGLLVHPCEGGFLLRSGSELRWVVKDLQMAVVPPLASHCPPRVPVCND